jgi:hypothetical protein
MRPIFVKKNISKLNVEIISCYNQKDYNENEADLIVYVCGTAEEVSQLFHKEIIGSKEAHVDFFRMNYVSQVKEKTINVLFNKRVTKNPNRRYAGNEVNADDTVSLTRQVFSPTQSPTASSQIDSNLSRPQHLYSIPSDTQSLVAFLVEFVQLNHEKRHFFKLKANFVDWLTEKRLSHSLNQLYQRELAKNPNQFAFDLTLCPSELVSDIQSEYFDSW